MKNFKDKNHRIAFTEAIDKHDKNDYAFIAAVYLLTVDFYSSTEFIRIDSVCIITSV